MFFYIIKGERRDDMRKSIGWYRKHDSLTGVKLKSVISEDASLFLHKTTYVVNIVHPELAHFYDVSGPEFGDQVICDLARIISCFFDENNIYRDSYNSFLIIGNQNDFKSHFDRLRDNCAHYKINGYLVYAALQFGIYSGYVNDESDLSKFIAQARTKSGEIKKEPKTTYKAILTDSKDVDEMTGLYKIESFKREASHMLAQADLVNQDLIMLFFNMSHFSTFTEHYGYEEGNKAVRRLAELINQYFPQRLKARLSADHFVVLTDEFGVTDLVHQINLSFHEEYFDKHLKVEAGAYRIKEYVSVSTAIERARIARRDAKDDKEVCFFDEEMRRQLLDEQYIVEHIEDAITQGDIEIYYQPIVRTLTGEIVSYEALTRWHNVHNKTLKPSEYVPILEKHHKIDILDRHVIEQACKDYVRGAQLTKHAISFSINLSLYDFELFDVINYLNQQTALYEIPRSYAHIEVTESRMHEMDDFVANQLECLNELGYELWLDDFNTQFNSLAVLKKKGFATVKLDIDSFKELDEDSNVLLKAIISLAKAMKMQCVIKGIETKKENDIVKQFSTDCLQGNYLGEPLPFSQCVKRERLDHLIYETPQSRRYQEAIASYDLSSEGEHENGNSGLCIVECKGNNKKVLLMDQPLEKLLERLGLHGASDLEKQLNFKPSIFDQHINEIVNNAKESSRPQPFSIVINNALVHARLSYLSESKEKLAFAVAVDYVEYTAKSKKDKNAVIAFKTLFDRCSLIYIMDLKNSSVEMVFKNYNIPDSILSIKDLNVYINDHYVYEEDREAYQNFMNEETLRDRLLTTEHGSIEAYFRFLSKNGNYLYKHLEITMMSNDSLLLYTVSATSIEPHSIDRSYIRPASEQKMRYSDIFESFIKETNIGFFWKDKNRKFLGANSIFLKYYDIKDIHEILGKNDEEIGWHIKPDFFREDEEQVLAEGVVKSERQTSCIVDGNLRKISATKFPVYSDGKIIGLGGYFEDITDKNELINQTLNYMDAKTQTMNITGLKISIEQFISEYKQNQRDFVYITFSFDNMRSFISNYGLDIVNKLLQSIASKIRDEIKNAALLAHIYGDIFVVLKQASEKEEVQELISQITSHIRNVKVGDNVYNPFISSAYAFYHEVDGKNVRIEDLVLKRLSKTKEQMKEMQEAYFKALSAANYKRYMKPYTAIFEHVVLMDENMNVLYSVNFDESLHKYMCEGDDAMVRKTQMYHNTYSGIRIILGRSYYCVTKYEAFDGRYFLVEVAKPVDL